MLGLVLLAVAAWLLMTTDGQTTVSDTAVLPLSVEFRPPGLAVLLAAVALVAATFLALAALETATAMQVLNRDRRIPPPLPAHLQQARRWTLGPVAVRSLAMEHPPEWPALAVPSEDLPPGTRLRCTVLVPAHDEEAVIKQILEKGTIQESQVRFSSPFPFPSHLSYLLLPLPLIKARWMQETDDYNPRVPSAPPPRTTLWAAVPATERANLKQTDRVCGEWRGREIRDHEHGL